MNMPEPVYSALFRSQLITAYQLVVHSPLKLTYLLLLLLSRSFVVLILMLAAFAIFFYLKLKPSLLLLLH